MQKIKQKIPVRHACADPDNSNRGVGGTGGGGGGGGGGEGWGGRVGGGRVELLLEGVSYQFFF